MVLITTPSTYYETLGWNFGFPGGGYCGIQDSGDSGKNYIFSLWDPSPGGESTAVYSDPSGVVSRFGGEGTGIHYLNYNLQWKVNQWYRLVVRAWDYKGQTYFALWSDDESAGAWTHHATFAYPVPGIRFSGPSTTISFIEDWAGTGQNTRRAQYNEGWKRLSSSRAWLPYTSAIFDVSSCTGEYCNAYDAGLENGAYYMQTGGNTTPTLGSGTTLTLPFTETAPALSVGRLTYVHVTPSRDAPNGIRISWDIDPAVSPQFSYEVDVFDTPDFSGFPIASKSDVDPDARSIVLSLPPLVSLRLYYVRVSIRDIFDQAAAPLSAPFPLLAMRTSRPIFSYSEPRAWAPQVAPTP
jgi:hypothetical protein